MQRAQGKEQGGKGGSGSSKGARAAKGGTGPGRGGGAAGARAGGGSMAPAAGAFGGTGSMNTRKLFIGNLTSEATEEDIVEAMCHVGEILSVRVLEGPGKFASIAFVEFQNVASVDVALSTMQGAMIRGRPVRLEPQSKPDAVASGSMGAAPPLAAQGPQAVPSPAAHPRGGGGPRSGMGPRQGPPPAAFAAAAEGLDHGAPLLADHGVAADADAAGGGAGACLGMPCAVGLISGHPAEPAPMGAAWAPPAAGAVAPGPVVVGPVAVGSAAAALAAAGPPGAAVPAPADSAQDHF